MGTAHHGEPHRTGAEPFRTGWLSLWTKRVCGPGQACCADTVCRRAPSHERGHDRAVLRPSANHPPVIKSHTRTNHVHYHRGMLETTPSDKKGKTRNNHPRRWLLMPNTVDRKHDNFGPINCLRTVRTRHRMYHAVLVPYDESLPCIAVRTTNVSSPCQALADSAIVIFGGRFVPPKVEPIRYKNHVCTLVLAYAAQAAAGRREIQAVYRRKSCE